MSSPSQSEVWRNSESKEPLAKVLRNRLTKKNFFETSENYIFQQASDDVKSRQLRQLGRIYEHQQQTWWDFSSRYFCEIISRLMDLYKDWKVHWICLTRKILKPVKIEYSSKLLIRLKGGSNAYSWVFVEVVRFFFQILMWDYFQPYGPV